jgi:hypothetical protein
MTPLEKLQRKTNVFSYKLGIASLMNETQPLMIDARIELMELHLNEAMTVLDNAIPDLALLPK